MVLAALVSETSAQASFDTESTTVAPVALLHGVDDACDAGFIDETKMLIAESAAHSGKKIVVECIVEGKMEAFSSIFTSMKKQTDDYCKKVKAHPIFSKTDFNIIGFS